MDWKILRTLSVLALFTAVGSYNAKADNVRKVFVIAMENHNWTQPANQFSGGIQQVFNNPNAPFINSLVNGTSPISKQVSYATAYHNAGSNANGTGLHIHPSEPNYLWAEAGTNFGIANDADPFPSNDINTTQHLSGLLQLAGITWKSYQEDIDIDVTSNTVLPQSQWTVPLVSQSGFFTSGTNAYNGSNQFNYAAKHNPMVFFTDTNGGDDTTNANPLRLNYAPLQQLSTDLANDTVADYNWITPNQYNDMHTALKAGFTNSNGVLLTGDAANIAQGDNFLSIVVPMIMASDAYKNHGVIVIWWDESESDGNAGDTPDDFNHDIGEIIISDHAAGNNGVPFASSVDFTHSSDLRTMQEIFGVTAEAPSGLLGDAANLPDLSDLFSPGAIPKKP